MLDTLFIFGAKYLYLVSVLIAAFIFFKGGVEEKKRMIVFGIISFGLAFVISLIAREMYFNPRPFVVGGFEPLIPHEPDNGFPSDHTLLVAAIASLFTFLHRRVSIWLWVVVLIVGISRIYTGVHHLTDVIGSALIALLAAGAAYAIIHKLWNKNTQTNSPSL
jgi:undecaprenyl-diphosphatase